MTEGLRPASAFSSTSSTHEGFRALEDDADADEVVDGAIEVSALPPSPPLSTPSESDSIPFLSMNPAVRVDADGASMQQVFRDLRTAEANVVDEEEEEEEDDVNEGGEFIDGMTRVLLLLLLLLTIDLGESFRMADEDGREEDENAAMILEEEEEEVAAEQVVIAASTSLS